MLATTRQIVHWYDQWVVRFGAVALAFFLGMAVANGFATREAVVSCVQDLSKAAKAEGKPLPQKAVQDVLKK